MSDCSLVVCAFTPLSSQTTARPDDRHLVRKPSRASDRQTVREPCRQGLWTVRNSRTVVVDTQSDGSRAVAETAAELKSSETENDGVPTPICRAVAATSARPASRSRAQITEPRAGGRGHPGP